MNRISKNFPLEIFILRNGLKEQSSYDYDRSIVPENYYQLLTPANANTCPNFGIAKPRQFIINLSIDLKLVIPIIYLGGNDRFIELFDRFKLIDSNFSYYGEILKDWYLELNLIEQTNT